MNFSNKLVVCFVICATLCSVEAIVLDTKAVQENYDCFVKYLNAEEPATANCRLVVPLLEQSIRTDFYNVFKKRFPSDTADCLMEKFNEREMVYFPIRGAVMEHSKTLSDSEKETHHSECTRQFKKLGGKIGFECLFRGVFNFTFK